MTKFFQTDDLEITIDKSGTEYYSKVSFPLRFGKFIQIDTKDFTFCFNQNHEIKIIQGKTNDWPNHNEWLKRTAGNDFVYYSSAGYKGTFSFIGEYYLPCFPYSDNRIFNVYGYDKETINTAFMALNRLFEKIKKIINRNNIPDTVKIALNNIVRNNLTKLKEKADDFHKITSGYITVLPPDSRHVDYDVIPVNIANGCLYNCGFCCVKTKKPFKIIEKDKIFSQIKKLKKLYKQDIYNYNSVFLGQHDALNADIETIIYAAKTCYQEFDFKNSNMKNHRLFMFGSVDSLINSGKNVFQRLDSLPFYTYINIGMESADQETLKLLQKPITEKKVKISFDKMLEINKKYKNIEITANFVMGQNLTDEHYDSILMLSQKRLKHFYSKGCFYISPLQNHGTTRYIHKKFLEIKNANLVSSYIYLIQRL